MKALIILATLLAIPAFADEKPFMEFGDIKGEASVIDNAEESAEVINSVAAEIPVCDAKDKSCARTITITNTGDENASAVEDGFGHDLDKSSTRAQDYNSSRCNRRGIRLDDDSDDDGLDAKDNAVDNDCDDTEGLEINRKRK